MTKEMGPSTLRGDMIRMPLPGGYVEYPYRFGDDAVRNKKYSVFITTGVKRTDPDILMATLNTGARTIIMGPSEKILPELKKLDWPEDAVITSSGRYYRKIAPSLDELLSFIREMKRRFNTE